MQLKNIGRFQIRIEDLPTAQPGSDQSFELALRQEPAPREVAQRPDAAATPVEREPDSAAPLETEVASRDGATEASPEQQPQTEHEPQEQADPAQVSQQQTTSTDPEVTEELEAPVEPIAQTPVVAVEQESVEVSQPEVDETLTAPLAAIQPIVVDEEASDDTGETDELLDTPETATTPTPVARQAAPRTDAPVTEAASESSSAPTEQPTAPVFEHAAPPTRAPRLTRQASSETEATTSESTPAVQTPVTPAPVVATPTQAKIDHAPNVAAAARTAAVAKSAPTPVAKPTAVPNPAAKPETTTTAKSKPARPTTQLDPRMLELSHEHRESMLRSISLAVAKDGGTMMIRLDPPDLGSLGIKLELQGSRLSLQLRSERREVAATLEQDSGRLQKLLEQQGLNVTEIDVGTSSRHEQERNASTFAEEHANWTGAGFEGSGQVDGQAPEPQPRRVLSLGASQVDLIA